MACIFDFFIATPASSCSSERAFSDMGYVHDGLRSKLSEERLEAQVLYRCVRRAAKAVPEKAPNLVCMPHAQAARLLERQIMGWRGRNVKLIPMPLKGVRVEVVYNKSKQATEAGI